jgi:hypothetical protein
LFYYRNPFPPLSNIDTLRKKKYDEFLSKSISSATLLKSLEKCDTVNTNMHSLIKNQNTYENFLLFLNVKQIIALLFFILSSDTFKYIYEQGSINDVASIKPILPCFGLFSHEPLGLYCGILRFTSNKYHFYLIGSKSSLIIPTAA